MKKFIQFIKKYLPQNIKYFLKEKIIYQLAPPRPWYLNERTFSQAGEDGVLKFLFLDCGVDMSKITYLDIGARHPTSGSNTFLLYTFGSSGVCVDSDKTFASLYKKERPKDKVLNIGVSDSTENLGQFFFMENGGSTFNKEEATKRTSDDKVKIVNVLKVPLININTLIKQNFETYPFFLSIDIEGLDLAVLKTLDFTKYPIPVICAETCDYSRTHIRPKNNNVSKFLISKGYEIYADTYINTIFVKKEWFNKIK